MKSPLNIYGESKVTNTLATDQARILKGIRGLVISLVFFATILLLIIFKVEYLNNLLLIISIALILSVSLLIYLIFTKRRIDKNKLNLDVLFKSYPNLTYNGSQYISVYTFTDSKLYDEVDYDYRGNDLLKSEKWEISNLNVKCRTTKSNKEKKVFRGCFLNYKTSLNIKNPIIIKPKPIGQNLIVPKVLNQLMNPYFNPKMQQRNMGHTAFDQLFHIYSSDAKEALLFLSENKMNTILSFYDHFKQIVEDQSYHHKNRIFKPKFDKPLNALELSFHKDGIYLAIREQKIFSLLKESINTKHQNIILDLIKYLDNI